jgi:hypothetical protein
MAKDIRKKTIGMLIDELFTVNMKLFHIQDDLAYPDFHTKKQVNKNVSEALKLNSLRNQLVIAIDKELGYGDVTRTKKTYE